MPHRNFHTRKQARLQHDANLAAHAEEGGGRIREVLESLAEVFNEALGPAVAEFTEKLSSMFAAFSEGPIIGSLNAIATVMGTLREVVGEVGGEFSTLSLEAQKAGVSVEFLDKFANVASTVGVSVQQLGLGFKILEQRAEEAQQGGKEAGEAFHRLGIDSSELATLLQDPEKLFNRVRESIGGMSSAAERNEEAQKLMGRGGASLIPIFAMARKEFDETGETMDRLKGGVNESSAQMGRDMTKLDAEVNAAMFGIKAAVSKPILTYLHDHMADTEGKIEDGTTKMVSIIGTSFDVATNAIHTTEAASKLAGVAVDKLCDELDRLSGSPVGTTLGNIKDILKPIYEYAEKLVEKIREGIDALQRLAGMDPVGGVKTDPTRGMDLQDAADELKKSSGWKGPDRKIVDHSGEDSPDASSSSDSPGAQAGGTVTGQHSTARQQRASDTASSHDFQIPAQQTAIADQAEFDSLRKSGMTNRQAIEVIKAKKKEDGPALQSPTAAPAPKNKPVDFSTVRTELTDAVKGDDGLYHIKSSSGGGIGGALDEEEYQNLRQSERDHRSNPKISGNDKARAAGQQQSSLANWHRDSGPDSIAQWKAAGGGQQGSGGGFGGGPSLDATFAQLSESINRLTSQANGGSGLGGSSARPDQGKSNVTYNVVVHTTADANQTASAIAAKIFPAIQKAQRDHDQAAAGAVQNKMVAAAMGGA
jgi:hypothetical protein